MKYTDVVKLIKQAAIEVANPPEPRPKKPASPPDPSRVGKATYKDPKTGKTITETVIRGASTQPQPVKRAPIKKPAPAPTTTKASIPMTFSTGPAAGMPYSSIKTRPFGNPISRRPKISHR